MHYEHLVAVNDLSNPLILALTRSQVWRGLLLKVEAPDLFLPNVEAAEIIQRSPSLLIREMQLGALKIRDHIHLQFEQQIRYETQANDQHAGGMLTIEIIEPDEDNLLVRFTYNTPSEETEEELKYASYLQKMWRDVDIESIRIIRALAEEEQLGA